MARVGSFNGIFNSGIFIYHLVCCQDLSNGNIALRKESDLERNDQMVLQKELEKVKAPKGAFLIENHREESLNSLNLNS